MIKKNEKIKTLETSISWLREESINLSHKNEKLQKVNKDLDQRLKLSQAECEDWAKTAAKNKSYNVVLQKTVSDLKNPALIHKYEE
jgi:regulator of replication initiation timing